MAISQSVTQDQLVSTRIEFQTTELNRGILMQLAKESNLPLPVFLEGILHGAVNGIIDALEATSETSSKEVFAELDKVLGTNLTDMVKT